jgi:putative flippase GtrA
VQETENKKSFKETHKNKYQMIVYTLVSLVTTVVELISFSLFNYVLFTSLSNQSFTLGFINYSVENGGLTIFLSISISFLIAQVFNFIMQRKKTFQANNHVFYSAILYTFMILIIFVLQMWLPPLLRGPLSEVMSTNLADFIAKNMMMTLAFIIQFPINKWVIMKNISEI